MGVMLVNVSTVLGGVPHGTLAGSHDSDSGT